MKNPSDMDPTLWYQTLVVQRVDNSNQEINHYPKDKICSTE